MFLIYYFLNFLFLPMPLLSFILYFCILFFPCYHLLCSFETCCKLACCTNNTLRFLAGVWSNFCVFSIWLTNDPGYLRRQSYWLRDRRPEFHSRAASTWAPWPIQPPIRRARRVELVVGQLNCCWSSAAQSILASGPVKTFVLLFFPPRHVCVWEMRPPLRRGEGSVFLWRRYVCCTAVSAQA
jgi:hypothetical protein